MKFGKNFKYVDGPQRDKSRNNIYEKEQKMWNQNEHKWRKRRVKYVLLEILNKEIFHWENLNWY